MSSSPEFPKPTSLTHLFGHHGNHLNNLPLAAETKFISRNIVNALKEDSIYLHIFAAPKMKWTAVLETMGPRLIHMSTKFEEAVLWGEDAFSQYMATTSTGKSATAMLPLAPLAPFSLSTMTER